MKIKDADSWPSAVVVTFVGITLAGSAAAAPQDASLACSDAAVKVYVASANGGPVGAYSATSAGAVAPVSLVVNPNLPGTVWDPWGITFDTQGNLFVQTFISDATSFVFGPDANGSANPLRIFRGDGPDTRSIALDGNGFEYIATGEGASIIDVLSPSASGQVNNLYSVAPLRSWQTDEAAFHPWPSLLTTDTDNNVVAAIARASGNAVEVFQGGASGSVTPLRTIAGSHTGLGTCAGASCDQVAVTFAASVSGYYVAVSATSGTHISLFPKDASGDVTPLMTIQGPNTGLTGRVITGIAASPCTGDLYAMVKTSQFSATGQINVYDSTAQGDTAPKRTFSDGSSSFADAQGIALGVKPSPIVPATAAWALGSLVAALVGTAVHRLRQLRLL